MPQTLTMIERSAWERGVGMWCSETPCCGREVHLHEGRWLYRACLEDAWDIPEVEPDPDNRYEWFWRQKHCRTCGTLWEVAFTVDEVQRPNDPRPSLEVRTAFWRHQ